LLFLLRNGINIKIIKELRAKIMVKVKNPNQLNIFDPWDFLSPKRRQMLDVGWPGLFREHILPLIPIDRVKKFFAPHSAVPRRGFTPCWEPLFSSSFLISLVKKHCNNILSISNGIIRSTSVKKSMLPVFH